MKTTEEWLNQLPEDYRDKALKNMIDPKAEHYSLAGAISNGFVWDSTPEGRDYWNGVFRELMYGEKFEPNTSIQVIESHPQIQEVRETIEVKDDFTEEKNLTSKTDDDFFFDSPDSERGGNAPDLLEKFKLQKEETK